MEIKVLDKGFVRQIETMGGDDGVVQAARVSYAGTSKGDEKDRKLITYLLKHQHLTPFEHALFKFHVKCPIFVMRQWIRHRFASYNEISYRYTIVQDDFYVPAEWRAQDLKNKQGSVAAAHLDQESLTRALAGAVDGAKETYRRMLEAGVAREMARMVLPVNLYTEFYWTVNARSLMNFVGLRADAHAQWEIQRYAEALAEHFAREMPWTYEAFLAQAWHGENPRLQADLERSRTEAEAATTPGTPA
ncbi:MAG: FAD-dependent thymidylate synthase [Elusimicrobia bacterium]|nr:FAD-dependent thymidylate synthase [Elusimicrobiota bacterium]